MEEITKFHVDWKKMVMVGMMVLLTTVAVGGGTWYFTDSINQDEIDTYKDRIADLERDVALLEEQGTAAETKVGETTAVANKTVKSADTDYQLIMSLSVKDRVAKVGAEKVFVRRIENGWATVDFTVYPSGTAFSDGAIFNKINGVWTKVATFDSAGALTMVGDYKESDIPSTIYQ